MKPHPLSLSTRLNFLPVASILLALALAGCAAPADSADSLQGAGVAPEPAPVDADPSAWSLWNQTALGYYEAVQAPFFVMYDPEPGYCPAVDLRVPAGTTRLVLNLSYEPMNTSKGSFGPLFGFSARSESHDTWVDYPGTFEQEKWRDNPKILEFNNPEPGTWHIYIFTMGAAVKQLATLTMGLEGSSAEVPDKIVAEKTRC